MKEKLIKGYKDSRLMFKSAWKDMSSTGFYGKKKKNKIKPYGHMILDY